MITTKLETSQIKVEIKHDDAIPSLVLDIITNLIKSVESFNQAVNLKKIEFKKINDEYSFSVEARDGREWKQKIWIDGTTNPLMTWEVNDQWRLSEVVFNREVQDTIIIFTNQYKVHKLEVSFV